MTGELYIDNIDVYTQFGVWITEGGYDGLLSFPALQDPDKNIWPEEDGIEVDLSTPTLSGKEVSITFVASNPGIDVSEFITSVSQPGYRVVRIPSLNKEWKLRLLSQPNNVIYGDSGNQTVSFSLNFADDFPLRPVSSPVAGGSGIAVPPSAYSLDGTAFDRYGIFVEAGRDSLLKSAAVKQNLTRKFKAMDGVLYDAGTLVFKEKDVTFKCCLIADSIDRFWQCYEAFFNDLIKPGERRLFVDYTSEEYLCYYKKSSDFKILSLSGKVVIEFNLTLVFTRFRITDVDYLLATEDGALVITEDLENYIDSQVYD